MKAARLHKTDGLDVLVYEVGAAPTSTSARGKNGDGSGFSSKSKRSELEVGTPILATPGAGGYRDLGPRGSPPLILQDHWGAALQNFDPRIVDGLATTSTGEPS